MAADARRPRETANRLSPVPAPRGDRRRRTAVLELFFKIAHHEVAPFSWEPAREQPRGEPRRRRFHFVSRRRSRPWAIAVNARYAWPSAATPAGRSAWNFRGLPPAWGAGSPPPEPGTPLLL